LALSIGSFIVALLYLWRVKDGEPENLNVKYEPFSLAPAIKFALLLTSVKLILQIASLAFGNSAFIILTALSGIVGIDVATISLGELVAGGSLTLSVAVFTYLLSNIVNFSAKTFYALKLGTAAYARVVAVGMALAALAAIGMLFLVR
jgi:uncharacterized membrane protein (DUF4010 family)